MIVLLLCVINVGLALRHSSNLHNHEYVARKRIELNLNETFFSSLENYQVNATPTTEVKYPWIAKVIHSRLNDSPYMCTASCIKKRIFVTAARCIHSLKVDHTTVIYQKTHRLPVLAFVLPSNGTKQAYDDVGFIVTSDTKFNNWKVVALHGWKNRTDDAFEWFKAMPSTGFLAVGYACTRLQGILPLKFPDTQYHLTELSVHIGLDICENILNFKHQRRGFRVPCYFSCSVDQFKKRNELCHKYHGVEGGAIIESKTNKLVGVSTWGPHFKGYELPAGMSVANSANFFKDYKCAINIVDSSKVKITNQNDLQKYC